MNEPVNNTQLAAQPEAARQLPLATRDALPQPNRMQEVLEKQGIYSTADRNTAQGRRDLANAVQGETIDAAELIGQPLELIGYTIKQVQKVNEEDGEIDTILCIVLHTKDGVNISTFSEWIYRSLMVLESLYGKGPWPNGVTVIPRKATGKSKRTRYFLEPIS